MTETVGWCCDCASYVPAERVPSLAHVNEMLESIRTGYEAYRLKLISLYGELSEPDWIIEKEFFTRGWQVKRWESIREWRLLRRSGPRCLDCFSTQIELLPINAMETVHPISGQRLRVEIVSHLSMNDGPEYTVEGLPLDAPDAPDS
jgi:hypothetical protein